MGVRVRDHFDGVVFLCGPVWTRVRVRVRVRVMVRVRGEGEGES